MSVADPWTFPMIGYVLTVAIELPILAVGLSHRHPLGRRLFCGIWLTACTYPVVILVLPVLLEPCGRSIYLWTAELFAPVAEMGLFWSLFRRMPATELPRDFEAILVANLSSFVIGGWLVQHFLC